MNRHWMLDNGHGGVKKRKYQTQGKRSPQWTDGPILYEGEFNRSIVARLVELLTAANIGYTMICPEQEDITLGERVRRANAIYKEDRTAILVSVHANAGGGRGYEIFTSPGETRSDAIATIFFEETAKVFPSRKMRQDTSDGDPDKEAEFYILTKTNCPAVLTENFFMDNERECRDYLMTKTGRDLIALAHFNAILKIEGEE